MDGDIHMPILMVALLALLVFGVIGGLLLLAVILESRQAHHRQQQVRGQSPANKPAA